MSLKEYAKKVGPIGKCWVCSLDQREEIDQAFRDGVQITVVARWLRDEHGLPATDAKVRHHHRSGHHAETP